MHSTSRTRLAVLTSLGCVCFVCVQPAATQRMSPHPAAALHPAKEAHSQKHAEETKPAEEDTPVSQQESIMHTHPRYDPLPSAVLGCPITRPNKPVDRISSPSTSHRCLIWLRSEKVGGRAVTLPDV